MRTVTVRGVRIPSIGLGTSGLRGDDARHITAHALGVGYRHVDTAQSYGNEVQIGDALHQSSVPRQEIWLTTKVRRERFRDGDLQQSVEESVRNLRTEPDLLLLHWPNSKVPLEETIGALNEVKRKGLTNHIGVSNFTTGLIRQALSLTTEPLIVNQVEYHPFLSQCAVLETLRANDMAMTAYCPLARGRVFPNRILQSIGEAYGKTAGQIALRWLLQQHNVTAIPRSSHETHIEANLAIFDFKLSDTELEQIFYLGSLHGRVNDPLRHAPAWDDISPIGIARSKAKQLLKVVTRRVQRRFR